METKLRNEIRKIINEIVISTKQPKSHKFFNLNNKEKQYGFQLKSGNIYYLSFLKTKIKPNKKDIYDVLKLKNHNLPIEAYAINFHADNNDPNNPNTHKKMTNQNEIANLLSSIGWLIQDFALNKSDNNVYIFSADNRRMMAYTNLFDSLKDLFYIFKPDMYDDKYEHKQTIMVKK